MPPLSAKKASALQRQTLTKSTRRAVAPSKGGKGAQGRTTPAPTPYNNDALTPTPPQGVSTPSPSATSNAAAMTRPPVPAPPKTQPPQAPSGTTTTTTTAQVAVSYQIGIANGAIQQEQPGFVEEYVAHLKEATYQVGVDAAATTSSNNNNNNGRRQTRAAVPHRVTVTAVNALTTTPTECPAMAGVVDDATVCETVDALLGVEMAPLATTQQGSDSESSTATTTKDAFAFTVETSIVEGDLQMALDALPWTTTDGGNNPIVVLTGLPLDGVTTPTDNNVQQENTDRTGVATDTTLRSSSDSSVSALTVVMTTLAACVFVILVFAAVVGVRRQNRRRRQQQDGDLSLWSEHEQQRQQKQHKRVVTQRQSSASSRRSGGSGGSSFHNRNREFVVLESDDEAVVFDDEMRVSKNIKNYNSNAFLLDTTIDPDLMAADKGADLLMDVADMERDDSQVEVGLIDVGGFQPTKYADIEVSTMGQRNDGQAKRGGSNNNSVEHKEPNTLSALGIRVLEKQAHVDRVREQIDAGAWTAVGTTAALLTNMSDSQSVVSSRSSASRKSYEDGGEPALGAARAAELDDYVETEDWEGLAAAVSRFQAEDALAGRNKKQGTDER